jgi:hypothetical protein
MKKPATTKRIMLNGRWWRIEIVPRIPDKERLDGCANFTTRTISIRRGVLDTNGFGVLVHELLHVLFPHHDEQNVLACEKAFCEAFIWFSKASGDRLAAQP